MRKLVRRGQRERREGLFGDHAPPQVTTTPAVPTGHGVINVTMDHGRIVLVERDANGVVTERERAAEYSCFLKRSEVTEQVLSVVRNHKSCRGLREEGEWVRVMWRTPWEREDCCKRLHDDGIQTYEGDVNPVRRYLTDHDLKIATPRTCFLDIETDSRVPPRLAAEGKARILCWCVYDTDNNVQVGMLKEDTDEDESRILRRLAGVLLRYDQVCSWNGDRFDFPCIKARAIRNKVAIQWHRLLLLDQMDVFIRMNTMAAESGEEKASFSLNAIAQELLKVGKDDFDSSKTWEAWLNDRQKLGRYNVQDTKLQKMIEDKTQYIALLQTLTETCNVFADSRGLNPTVQAEGFLLKLGARRGYRFPTNFKRGQYHAAFEGAFVMEPQQGGIIKNVHVGDFASLYPSIIVTWNMSPETIVQGEEHSRLEEELGIGAAPLEDSWTIAPLTGRFFRKGEQGILPQAVLEVMRLRKYWNDLKASLPPGSPEWVEANRKATAYKIAANSFYGIVGSPMSRFFDPGVAESVTQAGAWLIKETMKAAEGRSMISIYGDTDSLFIAGCTREEFKRFVEWCNAELYPTLLQNWGCEVNLIKLAYEKEFERLIFTSAKKYVGRYAHFKGTPATEKSRPEIKGLEYKRGDSIRLARQFQAEVIDLLMGGGVVRELRTDECIESPVHFEDVVSKWRARVLYEPLEIADVVIRKRLQKELDEYSRKTKLDGGFAKQLPHIELARTMLERGEDVSVGTKIGYFVLDASVKGDVQYLLENEWAGECDRYDVWERLVWPPTERLLSASFPGYSWAQYKKVRPKAPRRGKATTTTRSVGDHTESTTSN